MTDLLVNQPTNHHIIPFDAPLFYPVVRCGKAIAYLSSPISSYNSAISSFGSLVSPVQV